MEQILLPPARRGGPTYMSAAGSFTSMSTQQIVKESASPTTELARSFERAARLRDSIGTDAYMPPEQCDPASWPGRIGPAADVWGLGATLYHAATGETPFPRGTAGSTDLTLRFPQLTEELKPFPKHVPSPLQDLIASMLAYDPAERPVVSDVAAASNHSLRHFRGSSGSHGAASASSDSRGFWGTAILRASIAK